MVTVVIGDMFDSKAQTFVNTVNCVGVMGKGVALEFKKRFPEMFRDYVVRCKRGQVRLGEPYLFRQLTLPWILNFPTKDHWRSLTKLEDIVRGVHYLIDHYRDWGITSLAIPPLGCGQGQLEWRVVGPTLYRLLSEIDVPVELYAPYGTPHEELLPGFLDADNQLEVTYSGMPEPQWVSPAAVVLAEAVKRIEDEPYHPPIGRTIFQKLAYVATDQGIPTGLEYIRGSYGPFAKGLKRLEARLVNNGILTEDRKGRMLAITTGPTFEAARKAYQDDIEFWDNAIDRIVNLFLRLDTDRAELVATSLFAARELEDRGAKPSERMVFDSVMDWKRRRKPLPEETAVGMTIRVLNEQDWLSVEQSNDLPLPTFEEVFA